MADDVNSEILRLLHEIRDEMRKTAARFDRLEWSMDAAIERMAKVKRVVATPPKMATLRWCVSDVEPRA